ncbi:hypothetical protein ATANTOWER_022800 [Ataeniobius toweri]|uniref:Uncharacterized protein n=1 Tax=Ataeniobius toweri TaxID=208326 RepID=A0ABU7ARI5_9TELE|nr:hypothetical protein [Ataeniobius toweri]
MVLFWNSDFQVFISKTACGEETVSVVAGFNRQRSVAPPEGKSLNRLCAGCVGSAEILAAPFLTLDLYKSWLEGRLALMILSADLIVHCSLDLSCFVDEPNHTEMDEDRRD